MGNGDYQSGLGAGFARARVIRADADDAINDWSAFASKLENKLLTETVERRVSCDYVRELRTALRAVAPQHPLLNDEVAAKLFERSRIQAYRQNGYEYDVTNGRARKKIP